MRNGIIAAAIALLGVTGSLWWLDRGEVVTLATVDETGAVSKTPLWIVEIDTALFLRASSRDASWLQRLKAHADVTVDRGRRRLEVRAIPINEAKLRDAVNLAMAQKYGFADRAVMFFRNPDESVPILLSDRPASRDRVVGGGP